MIVMGDAPPRDPEPDTGYTSASVARASWEVDPVVVYGIDTGSLSSKSFKDLVSRSSGTAASTQSPDQIAELINQAVDSELSKPFAWIQGPYVIKAGDSLTLDALGSYAASGSITSFEWGFNGDGVYDQTTMEGTVTHTFPEELNGHVAVRVTQTDAQSAVATTPIMETDDGDSTPAPGPAPSETAEPAGTIPQPAATGKPASRLPQTGAPVAQGIAVVSVLLLSGAAVVTLNRRRSSSG